MPNYVFPDQETRRIADAVRRVEADPRDLTRRFRKWGPVPIEITRFEMTEALNLPQNGPGVSWAHRLRWSRDDSHVGWDYDTFLGIPGEEWYGDYTGGFAPDNHVEKIILVDGLRKHSKMLTRTSGTEGDVGAYGIAWKPQDGPVLTDWDHSGYYDLPPVGKNFAVWEVLSMQTPGDFWGRLDLPLDRDDAAVDVTAFRMWGTGHYTLFGYDVFGPLHGTTIEVYNPKGSWDGSSFEGYQFAGHAGDVVYCRWHMRENRYVIMAVEPNDRGWLTQTVVTSVNFAEQTTTTVDMKYPPWAPPV